MSLQSLVLCSDEKIVRILRRVLSELEISIQHAPDAEFAVRKLTRQRFEAVIVDCQDEQAAAQVLRSARSAPCNKHAIAVAIIDGQTALRSAFDLGAHFVLYKPISMERAKSSFRAARALMKRERRRNMRVPVELPVVLSASGTLGDIRSTSFDLSEGGMALKLTQKIRNPGSMQISFTLPGNEYNVQCGAEVAWVNPNRQTGIRFVDPSAEAMRQIKDWLKSRSPEMETDDPPAPCKLTDLSLGGCYVEMPSPFPARTDVVLSMRVGDAELRASGVVRVMYPEQGMGIEFTRKTMNQRRQVEKFINTLASSAGAVPQLMVEPEGLHEEESADSKASDSAENVNLEDALLELFQRSHDLTPEAFQSELVKQRLSSNDNRAAMSTAGD